MAKFTKLPYKLSDTRADMPFDLIHIDTWGPYKVNTRGLFKYFLTVVDDHTRYTWLFLMKNKSDYASCIQNFCKYVHTHFVGATVKSIRSDNAPEFADATCTQFYRSSGIVHQKSCVNRPQQNARVERKHRQILEIARCLKFQSGLPLSYWGEFVMTATYLINRLPTQALNHKIPYEILYNDPVAFEDLRAFGCLTLASNPSQTHDKFDPRAVPYVMIGYPPNQKGYKLLNLTTMQMFVTRDVIFHETIFPLNPTSPKPYVQPAPCKMPQPAQPNNICVDDIFVTEIDETQDEPNNQTTQHSPVLRRSARVTKPPTWLDNFVTTPPSANVAYVTDQVINPQFNCFLVSLSNTSDPVTFNQAVQEVHWVDAMNRELSALEDNGTWEMTTLPPGKKAIPCKWLFKTKYNPDGTVERHKARLVVLGCKQIYGIDYMDTFAPVAKLTTVRTLLIVAAINDWIAIQMDVTNAFLHGDLHETVYMKCPQGYKGWGSRISVQQASTTSQVLVCRLVKSLYGLKQSPRLWFNKLSLKLITLDYSQSKTDYSLFTNRQDSKITLVLVYVDDLLISGNSYEEIDSLKALLSTSFHMKDLGNVRYFLGLEIDKTPAGYFVSQRKYTMDLLANFGMQNATPVKVPMDCHLKLHPDKGEPLVDPHPYQQLLGKLIYLNVTRPDITFPVHVLSQYMHKPTNVHMQAAKRVLRYLVNNPSQGILLANSSSAQVHAYCDSDWASCPATRLSTSGFCILLGSSPISWKSKKQSVVARSTAEAEYKAMALTACEITWIAALLKDMGLQNLPPTLLKCDNLAAFSIAANPVLHERTKHIEIDCHFIRDKINSGSIVTHYVPSHAQLADIMTKTLPVKQHMNLLHKLGASSSSAAPLEGE